MNNDDNPLTLVAAVLLLAVICFGFGIALGRLAKYDCPPVVVERK